MTPFDHCQYYQARAQSSRRLAAQAIDVRIRAIHLELARRYDTVSGQLPNRYDDEF